MGCCQSDIAASRPNGAAGKAGTAGNRPVPRKPSSPRPAAAQQQQLQQQPGNTYREREPTYVAPGGGDARASENGVRAGAPARHPVSPGGARGHPVSPGGSLADSECVRSPATPHSASTFGKPTRPKQPLYCTSAPSSTKMSSPTSSSGPPTRPAHRAARTPPASMLNQAERQSKLERKARAHSLNAGGASSDPSSAATTPKPNGQQQQAFASRQEGGRSLMATQKDNHILNRRVDSLTDVPGGKKARNSVTFVDRTPSYSPACAPYGHDDEECEALDPQELENLLLDEKERDYIVPTSITYRSSMLDPQYLSHHGVGDPTLAQPTARANLLFGIALQGRDIGGSPGIPPDKLQKAFDKDPDLLASTGWPAERPSAELIELLLESSKAFSGRADAVITQQAITRYCTCRWLFDLIDTSNNGRFSAWDLATALRDNPDVGRELAVPPYLATPLFRQISPGQPHTTLPIFYAFFHKIELRMASEPIQSYHDVLRRLMPPVEADSCVSTADIISRFKGDRYLQLELGWSDPAAALTSIGPRPKRVLAENLLKLRWAWSRADSAHDGFIGACELGDALQEADVAECLCRCVGDVREVWKELDESGTGVTMWYDFYKYFSEDLQRRQRGLSPQTERAVVPSPALRLKKTAAVHATVASCCVVAASLSEVGFNAVLVASLPASLANSPEPTPTLSVLLMSPGASSATPNARPMQNGGAPPLLDGPAPLLPPASAAAAAAENQRTPSNSSLGSIGSSVERRHQQQVQQNHHAHQLQQQPQPQLQQQPAGRFAPDMPMPDTPPPPPPPPNGVPPVKRPAPQDKAEAADENGLPLQAEEEEDDEPDSRHFDVSTPQFPEQPGDRYTRLKKLGEGNFGIVYLVQRKSDSLLLVTKEPKRPIGSMTPQKRARDAKRMRKVQKEAAHLMRLKHPNILRFIEAYWANGALNIVTEYCDGGDLAAWLTRYRTTSSIATKWAIFEQIAEALHYMHERSILHRDLKPANILLTSRGLVKLADFGLARALQPDEQVAHTICGTELYMAPEVHNRMPYGRSADVFALGCILYQMCKGRKPYVNLMELLDCRPPQDAPSYARRMIRDMLHADLTQRPTIAQILRRCPDYRPRRTKAKTLLLIWNRKADAGEWPTPRLARLALSYLLVIPY
ncbi:putative serine/threonine-protein kinase nek3 [Diplonema papillatum]|nr:putative serine/threonine-protein kinase nek3 [Diplonema papillatum]